MSSMQRSELIPNKLYMMKEASTERGKRFTGRKFRVKFVRIDSDDGCHVEKDNGGSFYCQINELFELNSCVHDCLECEGRCDFYQE